MLIMIQKYLGISDRNELLKKINNNFALALDSKGTQIIVEGKGIGFRKMPEELADLSVISRTYYGVKDQDVSLIQSIDDEIMELASKVSAYANDRIGDKLSPSLTFILADHIQFSIERYKNDMKIRMPIYYDINLLYPVEVEIAQYAMWMIHRELGVELPESELTGIALNIINSELDMGTSEEDKGELVESIATFIESSFQIKISRKKFNYTRFVSHMEYLLRRAKEYREVSEENLKMYRALKKEFPDINRCVNGIERILKKNGYYLNEEEKLYLIMHVNRLCEREGL